MSEDEHREQKNGKVCHKYEFILVYGHALLVSIKKAGIDFVAHQFDDVSCKQ